MATLNFPDNPDTGDTYYDSNAGFTYEWNGTVWISIDSSRRSNIQEIDDISGAFDGSTTDFILNVAANPIEPVNAQQVVISVGGVLQNSGDDYTINGSTITFTTAPENGLTFFGTYLNTSLSFNTIGDSTVSTGSLAASGNYTVGGINVTGVSTLSGLSYSGISSIADLKSDNLAVSGVGTISNILLTKSGTGVGATVGAAVGVVTYYGDASNLTGVGMSLFPLSYDPGITSTSIAASTNIVTTWNYPIQAGSGTITIRTGGGTGTIVDQFVVGSSSSITISGRSLTLNPAADLTSGTEHFVVYPAGAIKSTGGQEENNQLITSFTTKPIELWAWGFNNSGQLGQNQGPAYLAAVSSPVQIPGTTWKDLPVNGCRLDTYFNSSIKSDGTLWMWGQNPYGHLGQNNRTACSSPMQVPGAWSTHSACYTAVLGIKTNGTLWSWGKNQYGQLGLNQGASPNQGYDNSKSSPVQVGTETTWSSVGSGAGVSGGVKTDGTLWTWGFNQEGSLGLNNSGTTWPDYNGSLSSPTQVGTDTTWSAFTSGQANSYAIKTDGTLWAWGQNTNGKLGLNSPQPNSRSSPTQIPGTWNFISVNNFWATAIKTNGTLWAWGYNSYGALGQNDRTTRSSPIQIGTDTTWSTGGIGDGHGSLFIKTDGSAWAWGGNQQGQLGLNQAATLYLSSPAQVGTDTNWVKALMSYHGSMGTRS